MTAPTVAALFGGPSPADPVPQIVERLERLLADARTGEVRAIAYAVVSRRAGGSIGSNWASAAGTTFQLAAAVMHLTVRFNDELVNGDR